MNRFRLIQRLGGLLRVFSVFFSNVYVLPTVLGLLVNQEWLRTGLLGG